MPHDQVPQLRYSMNDVLLLLGQCTVELAFLRARVAELEQQVKHVAEPQNGLAQREALLEPKG